jgi:hypothetical protein
MSTGNPFTTTGSREFLIGAAGALCVVGGLVAFRTATHEDPPPPSEWLTEAGQEELADALTHFDGWAAGCLWEARTALGSTRWWRSLAAGRHAGGQRPTRVGR